MSKIYLTMFVLFLLPDAVAAHEWIRVYKCPGVSIYSLESLSTLLITHKINYVEGLSSKEEMTRELIGNACNKDESWCTEIVLVGKERLRLSYDGETPSYLNILFNEPGAETCQYFVQSM